MFHSEEERNRTVELINELQHSDGAISSNAPNTFELGHNDDFDFGLDFECDLGAEITAEVNSVTSTIVCESQSFTTFTPEDKWPI